MIDDEGGSAPLVAASVVIGSIGAVVAAAVVGGPALKLVAGLVMIGVLVVIHEFRPLPGGPPVQGGHARVLRGHRQPPVGVRAFDTDFRISMLPFGGYVQMAGADPFGEGPGPARRARARLHAQARLAAALIMLAGPGMNIALSYAVFTLVAMLGEPVADAVVGYVSPGTAAEAAGVQPGDRIVAVDGQPVAIWGDAVGLGAA
ncbi:MAG: M50 family metallopeptidase [Myxococcota bacterium]